MRDECPKGGKREPYLKWVIFSVTGISFRMNVGCVDFDETKAEDLSLWPKDHFCAALSVMMLASGDYRYDVFGIADLMVQHLRRSRVCMCGHFLLILSNFTRYGKMTKVICSCFYKMTIFTTFVV